MNLGHSGNMLVVLVVLVLVIFRAGGCVAVDNFAS